MITIDETVYENDNKMSYIDNPFQNLLLFLQLYCCEINVLFI